jgi:hypothetical protein
VSTVDPSISRETSRYEIKLWRGALHSQTVHAILERRFCKDVIGSSRLHRSFGATDGFSLISNLGSHVGALHEDVFELLCIVALGDAADGTDLIGAGSMDFPIQLHEPMTRLSEAQRSLRCRCPNVLAYWPFSEFSSRRYRIRRKE